MTLTQWKQQLLVRQREALTLRRIKPFYGSFCFRHHLDRHTPAQRKTLVAWLGCMLLVAAPQGLRGQVFLKRQS